MFIQSAQRIYEFIGHFSKLLYKVDNAILFFKHPKKLVKTSLDIL